MTKTLHKTLSVARPTVGRSRRVAASHQRLMPDLHDPESGRLDARRVAAWLDLPVATLAHLLGRTSAAVHKTPSALSIQEDLAVYYRIANALNHLAGSEAGRKVWLHAPNPDFGGAAPHTLIRQGRADVVAELLADALTGHPG